MVDWHPPDSWQDGEFVGAQKFNNNLIQNSLAIYERTNGAYLHYEENLSFQTTSPDWVTFYRQTVTTHGGDLLLSGTGYFNTGTSSGEFGMLWGVSVNGANTRTIGSLEQDGQVRNGDAYANFMYIIYDLVAGTYEIDIQVQMVLFPETGVRLNNINILYWELSAGSNP